MINRIAVSPAINFKVQITTLMLGEDLVFKTKTLSWNLLTNSSPKAPPTFQVSALYFIDSDYKQPNQN